MYRYTIYRPNAKPQKLLIPSKASELTLDQWAKFGEAVDAAPAWFKEVEALDTLSENELALYSYHITRILEAVTGVELQTATEIKRPENAENDPMAALYVIYIRLNTLITQYQPKEQRQTFTYKGRVYRIPHRVIDAFTGKARNPRLTTAEGWLLLQTQHNYRKAVAENNKRGMYYLLLTMIATVAREKHEVLPLSDSELEDYTARRMAHFKELPYDVAMDFWFFFARGRQH